MNSEKMPLKHDLHKQNNWKNLLKSVDLIFIFIFQRLWSNSFPLYRSDNKKKKEKIKQKEKKKAASGREAPSEMISTQVIILKVKLLCVR